MTTKLFNNLNEFKEILKSIKAVIFNSAFIMVSDDILYRQLSNLIQWSSNFLMHLTHLREQRHNSKNAILQDRRF